MNISRYLIVGRRTRYGKPVARLTTNAPSLESYEVAIKLSIELPDALFTKPHLQASISISDDAVSAPTIEAEVIDNIQETISKNLGVDLSISLLTDSED